ncbi:MAG: XisI protein [Cytophagales bacterium]|nr:XisI protein [Armatimonadota bacterium]
MHIELRGGKFWIEYDGTEDGVATDLLEAGIPKDRIVLAFQPPGRHQFSEFAMA